MRNALLLIALPALALGACGIGKQKSLDEFAVARNAPLVIPPDFALTPPVAGTVSLSAESAQGQAIDTLFGSPAQRSATETSVLEAAGRDRVAPVSARPRATPPPMSSTSSTCISAT